VETCLSRLRSDDSVTRRWTWTRAAIESGPSCSTGRQQPCWERLCLDPTHSSSVLSVLSLSRFADICNIWNYVVISSRVDKLYSCRRRKTYDASTNQSNFDCTQSYKRITCHSRHLMKSLRQILDDRGRYYLLWLDFCHNRLIAYVQNSWDLGANSRQVTLQFCIAPLRTFMH